MPETEANFIEKEVPLEAVDGTRVDFTLTKIIDEIDDCWVDGAIYLGAVTHSGYIVTLEEAPVYQIYVDYYYL